MRWGLVGRADNGGLGNLSWQIQEHLSPDRTLAVTLPDPVGGVDYLKRIGDGDWIVAYPDLDEDTVRDFLSRLDVVLCLETSYDRRFWSWCADAGVRTHLYAMPELLVPADRRGPAPDRIWFPEPIGFDAGLNPLDYLPPGRFGILPWPAPTDDVLTNERGNAALGGEPRLLHQTGRAMLDRNGTDALLAACDLMDVPATLLIVGTGTDRREKRGAVEVTWSSWAPDQWQLLYSTEDLLVLPRRYGWLSLPILEAAAAGMATVTTDLHPQNSWLLPWAPELLVGVLGSPRAAVMKGGVVNVWEPSVPQLAARLDRLCRTPALLGDLGLRARAWAETRSWETLRPAWEEALRS